LIFAEINIRAKKSPDYGRGKKNVVSID
jgi:hypothetical protein